MLQILQLCSLVAAFGIGRQAEAAIGDVWQFHAMRCDLPKCTAVWVISSILESQAVEILDSRSFRGFCIGVSPRNAACSKAGTNPDMNAV